MPRLRCSSTRASVMCRSTADAVRPARCTNPAVIRPYSALPISNSPSPESSITWFMSRAPSSSGRTRCCVSVSAASLIASRSLSTVKIRSNEGIFFSIGLHSSTRRAPSRSSDSGLMLTRKSWRSGRTSLSKLKVPWVQVTFNFESEVRPERQDFLVNINPESLLLEGARRVDEWSPIEKKIPSFDLIFTVDKDRLAISEAALTETQQRVLPLLDGARDMNQVIEDSGLGEFEIGKALYGLITAGFVHRAGRTASAVDRHITDARVDEHRNLGIAFYKTGMLDEAAREFRRVAELRPSEANAHFFIGLVALKQARWREAMEALRLAAEKGGGRPAVFHNLAYAYEQLGRLKEAEAAYAEAAARARTDARVYLGWGIVALKQGDYASAAGRLDRAKELAGETPPAAWYWARALAAAGAGDFELAEQLAGEAAAAYPMHAVLLNNLAVLKELAGDLEAARSEE